MTYCQRKKSCFEINHSHINYNWWRQYWGSHIDKRAYLLRIQRNLHSIRCVVFCSARLHVTIARKSHEHIRSVPIWFCNNLARNLSYGTVAHEYILDCTSSDWIGFEALSRFILFKLQFSANTLRMLLAHSLPLVILPWPSFMVQFWITI